MGVCRSCRKNPGTIGPRGGLMCDECRERSKMKRRMVSSAELREENRRQKERYIAAGICYACGQRPFTIGVRGGKICDECRNRRAKNPEMQKAYEIWLGERYRNECFDLFGTSCVRCGNDDRDVLEFHHKDGRQEDEKRKGGRSYYRDLARSGRSDLVTLCANCHKKAHREAWREENKNLPIYTPRPRLRRPSSPPE